MSIVDIVLLVFIIFGAWKGYREGFLLELFSLLGIVLGVLGGFKLMGIALIYLSDHFEIDEKILPYVAFAVVFIAIVVAVSLIGRMIRASIDKTFLGRVDEAAGLILGGFKMAFLLSVVLWLLKSFDYELPAQWIEGSQITPWVAAIAPGVSDWLSEFVPAFHNIFE